MTHGYDGADRRSGERIPIDEPGTIVFPNGHTRMPCQLVNYSEGGVLLKVDAEATLPSEFTLLTENPDFCSVCRVAWRIGTRTGCEFIVKFGETGVSDNHVLPVQSQTAHRVVHSRLLKHPLIIS